MDLKNGCDRKWMRDITQSSADCLFLYSEASHRHLLLWLEWELSQLQKRCLMLATLHENHFDYFEQ